MAKNRPGHVLDIHFDDPDTGALDLRRGSVRVATAGRGFTDLTATVQDWLSDISAEFGLLTLFVRHTSASLTIQENADPTVQDDLLDALDRLAPEGADYRHSLEGPDDMPAHIKALITSTSLSVPIADANMLLGTWQGIYLMEHRDAPHDREIALMFLGRSKV